MDFTTTSSSLCSSVEGIIQFIENESTANQQINKIQARRILNDRASDP